MKIPQEFIDELKEIIKDINMQIRSYAPLSKLQDDDFKDSVNMLQWVRDMKLKPLIKKYSEEEKCQT